MFRFLKIVALVFLTILVISAFSLHVYIRREGRKFVCEKLKEIFGREVTIGSIKTVFPMDVVIQDLKIEGVGSVRQAIAWGGFTDIFNGNLNLAELRLIGADITVARPLRPKVEVLPVETVPPAADAVPAPVVPAAPAQMPAIQPPPPVIQPPPSVIQQAARTISHAVAIKRFTFSDSAIHFVDPNAGDTGINVSATHITGEVRNLQFPALSSVVTTFKLTGVIPWENLKEQGSIALNGWINLYEKDMRADLKVRDIDGLSFYPYYACWLNMDKAKVDRARLNFESQITGLKNDVVMDCHLEMAELTFKNHREGEAQQKEEKLTCAIVDIVRALNKGKVELDFKIKTTMDSPEFGGGVIKSAFDAKINQAIQSDYVRPRLVTVPARIVGGTFQAAAELTRSLINGTVGLGRAVASGFSRSFDRDRKPVPAGAQ